MQSKIKTSVKIGNQFSLGKLMLFDVKRQGLGKLGDMSRIDLVSKNLLANVFRNCRKRNTVIEKKLCQKITYKYQSFHIAKNILLTFEIFAIFAIFLLYFSDSISL